MTETIKIIVIDPVAHVVEEREIVPSLEQLQVIVGGPIEGVTGISQWWPDHILCVNEDAKLSGPTSCFVMKREGDTMPVLLAGPGIILSTDSEGSDQSHSLDIREVSRSVMFVGKRSFNESIRIL